MKKYSQYSITTKFVICWIIASTLSLVLYTYSSFHIANIVTNSKSSINITFSNFFNPIVITGYINNFIVIAIYLLIYYHIHHLLPLKSKILKTLFVTLLLIGMKGQLIYKPFVDFLFSPPMQQSALQSLRLKYSYLSYLNQVISLFLLSFCFVYLCPNKKLQKTKIKTKNPKAS
jgi:hypothetical protein